MLPSVLGVAILAISISGPAPCSGLQVVEDAESAKPLTADLPPRTVSKSKSTVNKSTVNKSTVNKSIVNKSTVNKSKSTVNKSTVSNSKSTVNKSKSTVNKSKRVVELTVNKSHPVVDSVLFNGEQDMYALRVNELDKAVDIFMVFEGVCAFTGKPKNLTFKQDDPRFGKASSKILYKKVPCFHDKDTWTNEKAMRKHIMDTIKESMPSISGPDWVNGAVMLSDVDEIPMADKLQVLFQQPGFWWNSQHGRVYRVRGQMYLYNVRCVGTKRSAVHWKGTHIMSGKRVDNGRAFEVARARMRASDFDDAIEEGAEADKVFIDLFESAWHFSFFLSPEDFRHKLETYSHQAYNKPPYTDLDKIRHKQAACIDPFGRHDYPTWKLKDSMHWKVPTWLPEAVKKGLLPKYWLTGVYD